mmetsp:Transcript_25208/g.74054  ORF Transcript_25208/g.74054 Transcript_25208/m.74054 type:complete len:255 (+) Transcript_25208:640-1404(+)
MIRRFVQHEGVGRLEREHGQRHPGLLSPAEGTDAAEGFLSSQSQSSHDRADLLVRHGKIPVLSLPRVRCGQVDRAGRNVQFLREILGEDPQSQPLVLDPGPPEQIEGPPQCRHEGRFARPVRSSQYELHPPIDPERYIPQQRSAVLVPYIGVAYGQQRLSDAPRGRGQYQLRLEVRLDYRDGGRIQFPLPPHPLERLDAGLGRRRLRRRRSPFIHVGLETGGFGRVAFVLGLLGRVGVCVCAREWDGAVFAVSR